MGVRTDGRESTRRSRCELRLRGRRQRLLTESWLYWANWEGVRLRVENDCKERKLVPDRVVG